MVRRFPYYVFDPMQKLKPIHEALVVGFEKWVEGDKLPNGGEITRVFMEQKEGLLIYGVYAARLPMATEKVGSVCLLLPPL